MPEALAELVVRMGVEAGQVRTNVQSQVKTPLADVDEVARRARSSVRDFGKAANDSALSLSSFGEHGAKAETALGKLAEKIRAYRQEETQQGRTTRFFARELGELIPDGAGAAAKALGVLATAGSAFGLAFEGIKLVIQAIGKTFVEAAEKEETLKQAHEAHADIARSAFNRIAREAELTADIQGKKFKESLDKGLQDYENFFDSAKKAYDSFRKTLAEADLSPAAKLTQTEVEKAAKKVFELRKEINNLVELQKDNTIELTKQVEISELIGIKTRKLAEAETAASAARAEGNRLAQETADNAAGLAIIQGQNAANVKKNILDPIEAARQAQAKADSEAKAAFEQRNKLLQEFKAELESLKGGGESFKIFERIQGGDIAEQLRKEFGTDQEGLIRARDQLLQLAADIWNEKASDALQKEAQEATKKITASLEELRKKRLEAADATELERVKSNLATGALSEQIAVLKAQNQPTEDFIKNHLDAAIAIDRTKEAAKKLKDQLDEEKRAFAKIQEAAATASRTIADSFEQNIGKGIGAVFEGIGASFTKLLGRMLLEAATANIAQAIFGTGLGKIGFDLFRSLSGGGAPAPAINTAFPPRAEGGPVMAGGSYLVGERGPELFSPSVTGHIIPNSEVGGAGGMAPVVQLKISERALNRTMRDWLEDELANQAATR